VYAGQVDPYRLHAACKLSDVFYVGTAGHECRDMRREYHPDGRLARTILFYYGSGARAAEVPSGTPLRRQVMYEAGQPESTLTKEARL
jgi:hypothetical protein